MKQEIIHQLHNSFENASLEKDNIEFWFAQDLKELLGYLQWRNFQLIIGKAKSLVKRQDNK